MKDKQTWTEARDYCEGEGMSLATFETEELFLDIKYIAGESNQRLTLDGPTMCQA